MVNVSLQIAEQLSELVICQQIACLLVAELRQCRFQFDRRNRDIQQGRPVHRLRKLNDYLDRPVMAESVSSANIHIAVIRE